MASNLCFSCGRSFAPRPQAPHQRFCSDSDCQRERRRRQQAKRRKASDQKPANAQYLRDWAAKHPGYWKRYRESHPDYAARNRALQKQRSQRRVAKEAVLFPEALCNGLYRLTPQPPSKLANEASWIVELRFLSAPEPPKPNTLQMKPRH